MKRTYSGAYKTPLISQEPRSRASSIGSYNGYGGGRAVQRRYKIQKVSKPLKLAIQRVVARNEEKKTNNYYSIGNPMVGSSNSGWANGCIPVSPNATGFIINQGTGQGQRVGNQIKVKQMRLKIIFTARAYNLSTNPTPMPFQVRCLLLKDKLGPCATPTNLTSELFQSSSTSIGPLNDLVDMILPINKDRYQVYYDTTVKVGPQFYTGTGSAPDTGNGSSNDFMYNPELNIDCSKFLPSKIQFDDTSSNPTSHGLWLLMIPTNANGSPIGAGWVVGDYNYSAELDYTDA